MSFLQRTYSYLDSKKVRYLFAVSTGLFACLFLLLFNPYDVHNWSFESPIFYNLPLWTAGLFAIPILCLSQIGLRPLLIKKEPFKLKHLFLLSAIELLLLGMLFFILFADRSSIKTDFWNELYTTFFYTILLASIVYVFGYLFLPYLQPKKTIAEAEAVAETKDSLAALLNFKSEKGKLELAVKSEALLYIKSEDNYVSVYHLMNGESKKKLIRTTLKNITKEIPDNSLIRVHRSYMINPDKIVRIDPVKDTYKISLAGVVESQIPVSSTYKENLLKLRPELAV